MNHQIPLKISLNETSTFDNFCWGHNTLIKQAMFHLLTNGSDPFLYIFGDAGSGKSHLLHAACQKIAEKNITATYLPLCIFKEWGIATIETPLLPTLLAIDDIDAIAGDASFEEALFHLYNRMRATKSGRLLITSQLPPQQLKISLPDLSSRLASGLSLKLEPLDDLQKMAVLKKRAKSRGIDLSDTVLHFLIHRYTRSMPALLALLETLDNASLAKRRRITIPFVKELLVL